MKVLWIIFKRKNIRRIPPYLDSASDASILSDTAYRINLEDGRFPDMRTRIQIQKTDIPNTAHITQR